MTPSVLPAYGLEDHGVVVAAFGSGLINNTWKVITGDEAFILQKVNNAVFKKPTDIAHNISLIGAYLRSKFPAYKFVSPLVCDKGDEMVYKEGEGYYRMFPFVTGSHSKDVVASPEQAYEAATQFGRFTRLLDGIAMDDLKTTIPHFHDLSLRYIHFLEALEDGNIQRIEESQELIKSLSSQAVIVEQFEGIHNNPGFKLRVTHHDTKISNVLFDDDDRGICVIDLDTVMPGYFISDVGDMMRTYLSPVSEEEKDFSRIEVRDDFYYAIVNGYYNEMKNELTDVEKGYFFYAGEFMIYMQAMRFLTDYLYDDRYYGASYPGQNYIRAGNQLELLKKLQEKKETLLQHSQALSAPGW
jgi:Ser/Thr protein kinase RdoA (MazF antagonist)